jgi:hypothetical protein
VGRRRGWGSAVSGRRVMRSPGWPPAARREDRVVFWLAVADSVATVDAAKLAGVSECDGP